MMIKKLSALLILLSTVSALANDNVPVVELGQEYSYGRSQSNQGSQSSLNKRVNQLERQATNQAKQNLPNRIEELQANLQKVRGEIEEQNYELQKLIKQQRTFYEDLDRRIVALQQSANSPANPVQSQTSLLSLPVIKTAIMQNEQNQKSVQVIYQETFDQVRNKNMNHIIIILNYFS